MGRLHLRFCSCFYLYYLQSGSNEHDRLAGLSCLFTVIRLACTYAGPVLQKARAQGLAWDHHGTPAAFSLVLDQFNGAAEWFLPIGVPIAATGIIFMWVLYGLLIGQRSIWLTLPAVIFLSGLLCICIDQIIKNALGEAGFPWGYLVASITSLIAIIISVLGFVLKKRSVQTE